MRNDNQFRIAFEALLRHVHDIPVAARPDLGVVPALPTRHAAQPATHTPGPLPTGSNTKSNHSRTGDSNQTDFNITSFKEAYQFAFAPDGLDLSRAEANRWALEAVSGKAPFDFKQYKEAYRFAFASDGLDLSRAEANGWALEVVSGKAPFDFQQYKEAYRFAFASDERWPRLSEQIFRVDKWSVCRG
jgi:hypothetical protein